MRLQEDSAIRDSESTNFAMRASLSLLLVGGRLGKQLVSIALEEDKLKPATKTFYSMSISAVLALLIGFVCQEGSELVRRITNGSMICEVSLLQY